MIRYRSLVVALALAALPLGASGCAGSVSHWIVQQRNHQGDVALANRNYPDASVAYQLALKMDPTNPHARDGLIGAQIRLAQTFFAASKFDESLQALAVASRYAPADDRLQSMRGEIEQAQLQRDIVVSNYPAYRVTGTAIQRAYAQLKAQNNDILLALKRFDYTYDTADLTAAIRQSYELHEDVARLTNRLLQYRRLVESGLPESRLQSEPAAAPASLLPLP